MRGTWRIWPLLALLPGIAVEARAETSRGALAARLEAIRRPAVGPRLELADGPIRVGRATLTTGRETPVFRLMAEGRTIGILVAGTCRLSYAVEDRFSIPVAKRNLRPSTGFTPRLDGGRLLIARELQGAAIWGRGIDAGLAERPADGAPPPRPAWLDRFLERKLTDNPERDLLLSEHDAGAPFRFAYFHAAGDDYVLDVDPRPFARTEQLDRLVEVEDGKLYKGRLANEELAAQPIDSQWWDPRPRDFVSVRTRVDLRESSPETAQIDSRIVFQALRDGLRHLPLSIVDRFEDDEGKVRELAVSDVLVDGRPADFHLHEGLLLIALPAPLANNATVTVEVKSGGRILYRPEQNSYWILRTQSWYPKPALGGGEFSTFEMSVESADPFVPFASGEVVAREKTASGTRVTTKLDTPMERAVAIAGRYTTFDQERNGSRIHVSTYGTAKKQAAERLAGIAYGVRACLENWLGTPFPFQDLQLVEIADWGWGQAPPGVIFITKEAFLTQANAGFEGEEEAAFYSRGVNERIAHELAHAWFPHVVKVFRSEENWLSESLAEYVSAECIRLSVPDKKQGAYFFNRQLSDWKLAQRDIGDGGAVFLATHLSGQKEADGRAWRELLYSRGPLVLHAVREELRKELGEKKGESAFLTWIRSYVTNFKYKSGETRHLVEILSQLSGRDWQPWFEKHLYGTEEPKVD